MDRRLAELLRELKPGTVPHKDFMQMALTLARAVSEAYSKYTDPNYTIQLGQYEIKDSIYVFESSEAGYVFFGFTASGSLSGSPPFNNLVVLRGTQSDEEAFGDLNWESTECLLPSKGGQTYANASPTPARQSSVALVRTKLFTAETPGRVGG